MALPALGPIGVAAAPAPGAPLALPPEPLLAETPQQGLPGTAGAAAVPAPRTPGELALQRRLEGAVFARELTAAAPPVPGTTPGVATAPTVHNGSEPGATPLAGWLTPTVAAAVPAQRLADARLLLPKGAFIDCTLETAIDSTLPGLTTCITAADTFSADGKVVLLERGTKLLGETRGAVQQGQARLFVLWTQARTPPGVIVPLDSPGTDELGRAGVTGEVQRHFWQRFGAAILISVVNGAVLAGVQAASPSNGTVIYAPSGSQDVLTEAMKDSVHIVPTIAVRNGARIQVLVARDIDFRPVYELRAAAAR
jgi:type IV secretion system protein VirB10